MSKDAHNIIAWGFFVLLAGLGIGACTLMTNIR